MAVIDVVLLGNLVQSVDAGIPAFQTFGQMRAGTHVLIPGPMKFDARFGQHVLKVKSPSFLRSSFSSDDLALGGLSSDGLSLDDLSFGRDSGFSLSGSHQSLSLSDLNFQSSQAATSAFKRVTSGRLPLPLPLPLPLSWGLPGIRPGEGLPFLNKVRVVGRDFLFLDLDVDPDVVGVTGVPFGDGEAMVGLGVEGVPFIMCLSHWSTGPVTKSPSSSSSSPGSPPTPPPPPGPTPPGN